jgi:broad specificity phosphatase PhoE
MANVLAFYRHPETHYGEERSPLGTQLTEEGTEELKRNIPGLSSALSSIAGEAVSDITLFCSREKRSKETGAILASHLEKLGNVRVSEAPQLDPLRIDDMDRYRRERKLLTMGHETWGQLFLKRKYMENSTSYREGFRGLLLRTSGWLVDNFFADGASGVKVVSGHGENGTALLRDVFGIDVGLLRNEFFILSNGGDDVRLDFRGQQYNFSKKGLTNY